MLAKSLGVALGLSLVAVAAAGQAQAADPGITKTKIVLGTTQPLTGAFSSYKAVSDGYDAYFKYLNANGGINGRQVELVIKDDQYANIAQTVTATNELINQNKIFAMFGALGTANRIAVSEILKKNNVPDVFINSGSSVFDNPTKYPSVFPILPSYLVEAKVMADYITKTKALASLKRCLVYQEGEFGDDAGLGFKAAGMTFTAQTSYTLAQLGSRNLRAQVGTLAAAGCELVVLFAVTPATGVLMATAAGARYAPKWMVTSVGSEPSILSATLAAAGIAAPKALLNGVYTPSFLLPITDVGNGYVSKSKAIVEAAGLTWNFYTYYGVNAAYVMSQALKAAGPNLTRKTLLKALQTKAGTFKSAANVPLRITPTSHQGYLGYWMGQYDAASTLVRLSKNVLVAGNSTTSGKVVQLSYKPATAPARLLP